MGGKPLGIGLSIKDGVPCFYSSPRDRVADHIWDTVRDAINAGVTPDQFKRETASAWKQHLQDDSIQAEKELLK